LRVPLAVFKAFSPQKVQEMKPDCTAVDALSAFPFLDPVTLGNLKQELPQYVAATEDISPTYSPLEFWKGHASSLTAWAAAARKVLVVQPSSAASERVISLLNNAFSQQQHSGLQDYIEASIMMQYNRR